MSAIDRFLDFAPSRVRDAAVTMGSTRLQVLRRSGEYRSWRQRYWEWRRLSLVGLQALQQDRLRLLLEHARTNSRFYRDRVVPGAAFNEIPILEKIDLQSRIDDIIVGPKGRLIPGFTGGTTGAAITVYSSREDLQQRFALLDLFWDSHGYAIGKERIAWFSGRRLVWNSDLRNRHFWRDNWLMKVRYYSTFHMTKDNMRLYLENLCSFRPTYMSGFPSAITELARYARAVGFHLPFTVKAVFVTSETLTDDQREIIEQVFGGKVRNQYSASEGAPFIVECPSGKLHLDLSSGVVEILDGDGHSSNEGEMIVTPFFTTATPVIRYRIGDRIKMADHQSCSCNWQAPLVDFIQGRSSDCIDFPGRGKIFCSQIGDCVKGVSTILRFQVALVNNELQVYLVADRSAFFAQDAETFTHKVHERMGEIPIAFHFVDDIPRTPSGKHSVVRRGVQ